MDTNLLLPHFKAYCHQCDQPTGTVLKPNLSGGVGNCCEICGACRKGRPYLSKREHTLMRERAEGVNIERFTLTD